jgi:hypothetical protein
MSESSPVGPCDTYEPSRCAYDGDEGISRITLAVSWTFTSLATVFVASRLIIRRRFMKRLHWDDWTMLLALALQYGFQAMITAACLAGLGRPFQNVNLHDFERSLEFETLSVAFSIPVSLVARVSITILLTKIFGLTRRWFHWFLIFWTIFAVIVGILGLVFNFTQVKPIEASWDPLIVPTNKMDIRIQEYTNVAFGFVLAISDLAYVFFPVAFVWTIRMPLVRKIGLVLLLGISILTFFAAMAKVIVAILALRGELPLTSSPDFGGAIFLVSGVEQALVISLGCVPTLGPVTKLQMPTITSIGQSIANLVSRSSGRSRKSSPERDRSIYHDQDLELAPPLRLSDGGSVSKTPSYQHVSVETRR